MIAQTVGDELGVPPDETTDDGIFTFTIVACLGCCSLAPVLMIDEQTFGRMTPQKVRKLLRQYRRKATQAATGASDETMSSRAVTSNA